MSGRALVVEDDADIRLLLRMLLSGEGFEVETVSDGPSAIRSLEREAPDIVITDLRLPGIDGHEVAAAVRSRSDVPVVLLTGEPTAVLAARESSGHVGVLVRKPFDNAALVATVRELIDARRARAGP